MKLASTALLSLSVLTLGLAASAVQAEPQKSLEEIQKERVNKDVSESDAQGNSTIGALAPAAGDENTDDKVKELKQKQRLERQALKEKNQAARKNLKSEQKAEHDALKNEVKAGHDAKKSERQQRKAAIKAKKAELKGLKAPAATEPNPTTGNE
ncbi:MAG: hypothetical protein EB060_02215 [Proteobacteria bacterium]|nr:hypothetical protein [Pseudomonadota bacterium]